MYHFSETQRTRAYRIALLVGCFGLFLFVSSAHAWNPLVVRGRCQQSGVQCSSTVGNAGGQGACCDPQSSTIASCESNNRCAGGIGGVVVVDDASDSFDVVPNPYA